MRKCWLAALLAGVLGASICSGAPTVYQGGGQTQPVELYVLVNDVLVPLSSATIMITGSIEVEIPPVTVESATVITISNMPPIEVSTSTVFDAVIKNWDDLIGQIFTVTPAGTGLFGGSSASATQYGAWVQNWPATQPVSGTVATSNTQYGAWVQKVETGQGRTMYFSAISAASSGANAIVSADASNKIKVVSYTIVADDAVTAKWQSGSTDLSGAMSFSANGGVAISGQPSSHLFQTAVNEALNLYLGGAVGVRGHVAYIKEP